MLEVFFPLGECSPIFDRKFVEISSQTRSMQSRLRNPSLDHKHDRTSFVRVCFSPESCGYCRSAAALINEEMFGNRAPLFHRIVCGKPPSAKAAHIHTQMQKRAGFIDFSKAGRRRRRRHIWAGMVRQINNRR